MNVKAFPNAGTAALRDFVKAKPRREISWVGGDFYYR